MPTLDSMFSDPAIVAAFRANLALAKANIENGPFDVAFVGIANEVDFSSMDEETIIAIIMMRLAKSMEEWDQTIYLPTLFATLLYKEVFPNVKRSEP